MIELMALYKFAIFGSLASAMGLSLVGAQWAARGQAVSAVVLAQAASVGVLAGLALRAWINSGHQHPHTEFSAVPLITGLTLAAAVHATTMRWLGPDRPGRDAHLVGAFALLMAAGYLIVTLVPGLEPHTASAYFGDLTVASDTESLIVGSLGLATVAHGAWAWRAQTRRSFDRAIFGMRFHRADRRAERASLWLSLVLVTASVQFLGLLFTLSALFLPAVALVARPTRAGLSGFMPRLLLTAGLGVVIGFASSLAHGRLPPVAAVAVAIPLIGWLIACLRRNA